MDTTAASTFAVTVGSAVAALSVVASVCSDGRKYKSRATQKFAHRTTQWTEIDLDSLYDEGWYREDFRCNRRSFDRIAEFVEKGWVNIHGELARNAHFNVRHRTAVALHYLCHSGSVSTSAQLFGMSKASASRYIWQFVWVVIKTFNQIQLPKSSHEWEELRCGFERICGFPNVYLVIDGSLFEIERPHDYEGWYCRKPYTAVNAERLRYNLPMKLFDEEVIISLLVLRKYPALLSKPPVVLSKTPPLLRICGVQRFRNLREFCAKCQVQENASR
ncbi:hypothetical protein AeRB84_007297 [Aphanomyces euteiches]|nr:hypothetical protein AeRB84_007297 [Aphanomyces euteiches]